MKTSEKTDKIYNALLNIKKEMTSVAKTSDNPFFKSKYADLNSHLEAVESLAEAQGCIVLQPINENNTVETRIVHVESSQFVASEMPLVLSKNNMQEAGSAITYARRYTLGALLSMKAEDDDGNVAVGNVVTKAKTTAPAKMTAPVNNTAASGPTSTMLVPASALAITQATPATPKGLKSSTFRNKGKGTEVQTPVAVTTPAQETSEESNWQ